MCLSSAAIAQDDEEEEDHKAEAYVPDDGGTASNTDAARTHVSETRLEQGSQQQLGDRGLPAVAAEDGPGEASSLELSDEQVCSGQGCHQIPQILVQSRRVQPQISHDAVHPVDHAAS